MNVDGLISPVSRSSWTAVPPLTHSAYDGRTATQENKHDIFKLSQTSLTMVHENAHNKISMQCDANTTTNLTLNLLRNDKFALQCVQTIANYTILATWLWHRLTNQHKVRHCTWHLSLWTNSGVARAPFCAPTPFVMGFPDNLRTIL